MKKLLLISALLIFACSSDDSSDNDDNSNQTFLEKYDGIIWEDIGNEDWGFHRFNNDLSNWYTIYDSSTWADVTCSNFGDLIDQYDLLNPENPYGVYYVLMINSEDVFQYNEYGIDENGVPELYFRYIFTVTDNGNTLDFVEQLPDGDVGTLTTTFQRASNEFNDFADIPFPCP